MPSYKEGQKVRARFTAIVGGREGRYSTTQVEEKDTGLTHYLYLGVQGSRNAVLSGDRLDGKPEPGDLIEVDFTATIKTDLEGGPSATTRVLDGSDFGYTHFLYLGSKNVTAEEAPVPEYKKGDMFRVTFTGTITGGRERNDLATTKVTDSAGYDHYLFEPRESSQPGENVTVDFTATVSEYTSESIGKAVLVQGRLYEKSGVFNHFIDLRAPGVTRISEETEKNPENYEAAVRPGDGTISSLYVNGRIEFLTRLGDRGSGNVLVTRNRNGETMGSFASLDEANYYVESNDYDPSRFTVAPEEGLDEADLSELSDLISLSASGKELFGYARWVTEGVTLRQRGYGYFNGGFARQAVAERLGISATVLEAPPFDQVDWAGEVSTELDENYTRVFFQGVTFYAKS